MAATGAAVTAARERTLPVHEALRPLIGDGALVRGRSLTCGGLAATSLALALSAEAVAAGAWLAVVGVPWIGVEATAELGVPLERLVRIDPPATTERSDATTWAELMAAVLDGFELVVTRIPPRLNAGLARRVQTRVQARGAVVIGLGVVDAWTSDLTLWAEAATWAGVTAGHGHLRARRVLVQSTARRDPRPRKAELWLPGPDGRLATLPQPAPTGASETPTDGEHEVRVAVAS